MAYLNLDLDYFDHPKVVRLVGQLGRGADLLPLRLWAYTGKYHAERGEWIGYSPLEIETAIKWWGQPGRALEALERPFMDKPGFLERIESGYKVHDWEKINGHIFALKERAQVAARARWDKYREEVDAQAMLKHSSSNAPGNALSLPSLPSFKEEESEPAPPGVSGFRIEPKSEEAAAHAAHRKQAAAAAMQEAKPKKKFPPESEPMIFAEFFSKFHRDWAKGAKPPDAMRLQRWAGCFDAINRLDHREWAEIERMLNAIDQEKPSKGSDFLWRKNILSPETFRVRWNEGKLHKFIQEGTHER